jgi:succinate dehydrogenase / fumarate reductase cytochrome b subunit
MSHSPATRQRPLSPHLTVYRWPITMTMSILHRITGGALYFGMLLIAWWLITAATSRQQFDFVNSIVTSWFGMLVLFGFTFALVLHAAGGIRHLVWDTGAALEKRTASSFAWGSLIGSIVITLLIWAVYFLVG